MLSSNPTSVHIVPQCHQHACCLTPIRNLRGLHLIVLTKSFPSLTSPPYAVSTIFVSKCVANTRATSSSAAAEPLVTKLSPWPAVSYPWLSETDIIGTTTTGLVPSLINVSVTSLPQHFLASRVPYLGLHVSPTNTWRCQFLWANNHDSSATSRMEERHSDVVSTNQAIMLALRIGFRGGLTQNDPGCLDWWVSPASASRPRGRTCCS